MSFKQISMATIPSIIKTLFNFSIIYIISISFLFCLQNSINRIISDQYQLPKSVSFRLALVHPYIKQRAWKS